MNFYGSRNFFTGAFYKYYSKQTFITKITLKFVDLTVVLIM
jgi:hypothetical protein